MIKNDNERKFKKYRGVVSELFRFAREVGKSIWKNREIRTVQYFGEVQYKFERRKFEASHFFLV